MLKENEVLDKGIQALEESLSAVPGLTIDRKASFQGDGEPDYLVKVRGPGYAQSLIIEVKSQGTPKMIRGAVNSLLLYLQKEPDAYGVVIAPYISSGSAQICDQAGIGYLDLSGNQKIAFQQLFILRENYPNQFPYKASIASLYSTKSERILRVLLTFPFQTWKTLELAKCAEVSPGMITHVRKKLADQEWIQSSHDGFQLTQPDDLLQDWSEHYAFDRNQTFDYYSLKSPSEIENDLAELCVQNKIEYALTGFSAANRLAPMTRNQRAMIYVGGDLSHIADQAGLKPVTSGANVTLVSPYDDGVFWKSEEVLGIRVATPIQVYLDLQKNRGRGEEAAQFLFKEVIQKVWEKQKSITMHSL